MEIILSTRNLTKINQIKAMFKGLNVQVLSLDDAHIVGEVVEDGTTLEENSFKKASFAQEKSGKWAIADDTGFFIDALDGKPGIHAARWAGDGLSTEDIMNFTLEKLKGVPLEKRTATFTTVAVIISPQGEKTVFQDSVHGIILTEPRTPCQPHMPYSALFIPDGQKKVWAEMSVAEENIISHRGKAFKKVRDFFSNILM